MATNTRTQRNPNNYDCVTEWSFTPVAWQDFVKQFPQEAASYVENYLDGWDDEDISNMESENPLEWSHLWDDEVFLNREGRPFILGNITGPGGSLWQAYINEGWDEVLLNDEDGSIEDMEDY